MTHSHKFWALYLENWRSWRVFRTLGVRREVTKLWNQYVAHRSISIALFNRFISRTCSGLGVFVSAKRFWFLRKKLTKNYLKKLFFLFEFFSKQLFKKNFLPQKSKNILQKLKIARDFGYWGKKSFFCLSKIKNYLQKQKAAPLQVYKIKRLNNA